jgi:MtN3 and saliva related transmembrane protein
MTLITVLATIFGTISGAANFPQAYKIFRRKSAKDISIITYSFLELGAIIWILYGIEIGEFPVIITNIVGAIAIGLVVIGWLLHGREPRRTTRKSRQGLNTSR